MHRCRILLAIAVLGGCNVQPKTEPLIVSQNVRTVRVGSADGAISCSGPHKPSGTPAPSLVPLRCLDGQQASIEITGLHGKVSLPSGASTGVALQETSDALVGVWYDQSPRLLSDTVSPSTSGYEPELRQSYRTYYRGPRGGCYYITGSGRKQYVDRSMCR